MHVTQAGLLAVPVAVAGFALAGTILASTLEPTTWTPVVDPAAASVTDVDDVADSGRVAPRGTYVYVFPQRPSYVMNRGPETTAAAVPPPRIDGELGIPQIVLDAYRSVEGALAESDESCHLRWQVLAGVGRVESDHARDGLVYADGTTFEPILGPVLDGGDHAAIHDTDDGLLDGDPVWDRAVGPMQFIPGTWQAIGVDGNDDGTANPHNVFDAARSAGRYLCLGSADLADRAGLEHALLRYNHSAEYVALVLAWIDGYTAGQVTPLPPKPTPPPTTTAPTTPPTTSPPTTSPTTSPGPTISVGPTRPPTTSTPPSASAPPTSTEETSTGTSTPLVRLPPE